MFFHRVVFFWAILVASFVATAQTPPQATPIATTPESVAIQTPALVEWKPNLKWSGDLRLRFSKSREDVDDIRDRQQLRARLGVTADVNEQTKVIMRLATATSAISTNQTLGDSADPGMSRRSFGLDLAYMNWRFSEQGQVWAGRVANPFWFPGQNQVVYDSDLAFEGLAFKYDKKWSASRAFFNAGSFIIAENYAAPYDVVDTGIVGFEAGRSLYIGKAIFTARLGQQLYINIQDKQINGIAKSAAIDPASYPFDRYLGNQVYVNNAALPPDQRKYYFQNRFSITTAGLEWRWKSSPYEIILFGELARNEEVQEAREATEVGASLQSGRFSIGYAQSTKQSESVVGAFSDSDMTGGGTDTRGERTTLGYEFSSNSSVLFSYFRGIRGVDTVSRDFTMSLLDFRVNF